MSNLVSSIVIPEFKNAKGHDLVTELCFNQPNLIKGFNSLQMEDFLGGDGDYLQNLVRERMRMFQVFRDDIFTPIISSLKTPSKLNPYDVRRVKYTELTKLHINPVIGLKDKIRMIEYIQFISDVMDDVYRIFDIDLPLLTKLVAKAVADRDILKTNKPVQAINDLVINSTDGEGLRKVVGKFVTPQNNPKPVQFGDYYYSTDEWLKANSLLAVVKTKLAKVPTSEYAKRLEALNILLDKFVKKVKLEKDLNSEKIRQVADLIEKTSNTIAVSGGILHMGSTLLTVMDEHNVVVNRFIEDNI